jgi:hypothetical protein
MVSPRCNICGRKLAVSVDPLSADCGGDCWGCVGAMEFGWPQSAERVAEEIRAGLREPDGAAKPPFDS